MGRLWFFGFLLLILGDRRKLSFPRFLSLPFLLLLLLLLGMGRRGLTRNRNLHLIELDMQLTLGELLSLLALKIFGERLKDIDTLVDTRSKIGDRKSRVIGIYFDGHYNDTERLEFVT